MKRLLVLESYLGGSHAHWLRGLRGHVAAEYTLLSLPPRKWKLRMQLAAPWFVEELRKLPRKERAFDLLLCTSLVDVAVLRALLTNLPGWRPATPIHLYFHENQFVYPERRADSGTLSFCSINWHSALAADSIAFNSAYNAATFFKGCRTFLAKVKETPLIHLMDGLEKKSRVLYPGVDFSGIDSQPWRGTTAVPVLVWNHRWEHDKNPEAFVAALLALAAAGVDFRLIILGQDFAKGRNSCFDGLRRILAAKILHAGFVSSTERYWQWLGQGDIVVSTARHEFFGVAVIEAVRAGCVPVLPERLAYPELFAAGCLYQDEDPAKKLAEVITAYRRPLRSQAQEMTARFSWERLGPEYSRWLDLD